jgi:hypothetical protein
MHPQVKLLRGLLPSAAILLTIVQAGSASASDLGVVGYYNQNTGSHAVTTLDRSAAPHTVSEQGFSPGWDIVAPAAVVSSDFAPAPGQLFYRRAGTGAAAFVVADANSTMSTLLSFAIWPNLTHVVSHQNILMFYNQDTGVGFAGELQDLGAYGGIVFKRFPTQLQFSPGWTSIVSTPGGMLFYNKNTGSAAVGQWTPTRYECLTLFVCHHLDATFSTKLTYAPGMFSTGWTHLVNTGDGIMFYRQSDGLVSVADVALNGAVTTRAASRGYILSNWTSVVAVGGNVFLYNRTRGDAEIGHFLSASEGTGTQVGGFHVDQTLPGAFSPNWSIVYPVSR